jgi:hypothetical protein
MPHKMMQILKHLKEESTLFSIIMTNRKPVACDLCNYVAKNGHIKTHKANKHGIGLVMKKCDIDGCTKEYKMKHQLKEHKRRKHGIGKQMCFVCEICKHTSGTEQELMNHKKTHNKDRVREHVCPYEHCDKTYLTTGDLARHIKTKHKNRTFVCDEEKCDEEFIQQYQLHDHKYDIHGIVTNKYPCKKCDQVFFKSCDHTKHLKNVHKEGNIPTCKVKGCDKNGYVFSSNAKLTQHNISYHTDKEDVVMYKCDYVDDGVVCDFESHREKNLDRHKNEVHGNIERFACTECREDGSACNATFTRRDNVSRHIKNFHDIGDNTCDICVKNTHSRIEYKKQHICNKCYLKRTGKKSRVEFTWSNYVDKHFGKEFLAGSDKSLKSMGGCQRYRPDKLYVGKDIVVIMECDEKQHKWANSTYSCDEKRISDIYNETGIIGKKLVVIRWNPHKYKVPDTYTTISGNDRMKMMVSLTKYVLANPPKEMIHIYYMFYDNDNPLLSQNIPHTLIYDTSDY